YENSPSLRSSPPRIPIPSTSLDGILESAMPHQGKRLFPQPVKEISVVSAWPAYPDTEIALRALQRGSDAQRRTRALALAEARQWA
ncbi:MAG: hypothetical protein U9R77_02950, partial [Pseudomonadota bacterium]|nr:hypothetical protein [Pseudomonadota bacterium]